MAAESASPHSIVAIADSNSPASTCQPRSAAQDNYLSNRRDRALAQLEASLEGSRLADGEQNSIWTAFQEMLNAIDGQSVTEQPVAEPFLNEQSAAVPGSEACTTWDEVTVAFGQELQRLRQAQTLSLEQIHFKTQVPLYQLQALESGSVDQLPEEIFVRSSLTRICAQLGAEGQALLAQLPAPQPSKQQILADWQQPSQTTASRVQVLHLRSSHLYLSYAALLAGATGGLTLSFQEAAQITASENSPQLLQTESTGKARLNPVQRAARFAFGSDVARPEQSAPETGP